MFMCLRLRTADKVSTDTEGLWGFVLGFVWNVFMCLKLSTTDKVLTSVELFLGAFILGFVFGVFTSLGLRTADKVSTSIEVLSGFVMGFCFGGLCFVSQPKYR